MNPYAPPKAPTSAGAEHTGHVAKVGLSFFVGMLSYYIFHWLSGILGNWVWPPFLKSVSRLYKPVTIPAADLVLVGAPMVLSYVVAAFIWFSVVRSGARSALIAFVFGWLVPTLIVIAYGEHKEPGAFLELWVKWPHAAILHFCPLIGIWLGSRLSLRQARGSADAA